MKFILYSLFLIKTCLFALEDSVLLQEIDSIHKEASPSHNPDLLFNEILSNACYTEVSQDHLVDEMIKYKNEDYGIDFESGGKYTQGDVKQNSRFLYAGIAWNLFSEGYYNNVNKAKILRLKDELKKLNSQSFTPAKYEKIQVYIYASFNNKKLQLYEKKMHFNTLFKDIVRKKYFLQLATKMEVEASRLTSQKDLFLQEEYSNFKERTQCQGRKDNEVWPYFKIDMFTLKHDLYSQLLGSSSECLENEIVNSTQDWKNSVKLKLFARGENADSGSGASLGFTLKIPLTEKRDNIARVKKLQDSAKNVGKYEYLEALLDRQYYDFNQKLAKSIKLSHTYKKILRKLELHRTSFNIYDKLDVFSFLKDIEEIYDVKLELLENKQQLYQKAFQILFVSRQESVKTLSPLHFEDKDSQKKIRLGRRSMYIWSKSFNEMDNKTLVNILQTKEVDEALISMSKKVDEKKLFEFIALAKKYQLKVRLVYSNNKAIYQKNYADLASAIHKAKKLGLNLQLDIEPHALKELKNNRTKYYQMYEKMLEYAFNESNETVQIDIAIPLHYNEGYVEVKYAPLVNEIYLMAYEHPNPEYVIRKVQKFLGFKEKLVIAVSPSDFKNEWEMERFIEKIAEKTKITKFAIHDIKKYKELLR